MKMAANIGAWMQRIIEMDNTISAITVIDLNGAILWQTNNWDLSADIPGIMQVWQGGGGGGSLNIQGIKYVILNAEPERIVARNMQGQGNIVLMKTGNGAIIAYVSPEGEPRSALTTMIEATRGFQL